MQLTRRIDNTLYSRKALAEAREAYREYCAVRAAAMPDGLVEITVQPHRQFESDARQIILEFWNFFLDTACEQRLEAD